MQKQQSSEAAKQPVQKQQSSEAAGAKAAKQRSSKAADGGVTELDIWIFAALLFDNLLTSRFRVSLFVTMETWPGGSRQVGAGLVGSGCVLVHE